MALPHTPLTPTRRTLAKGVAWSVPAVTLASTAPAYASSTCLTAAVSRAGWSVTSGSLDVTGNTGWLVRGSYGQPGMVSAAQAQYFDGTQTGSGTSNQPDGSFLSFANNASTSASTVILVRYAFQVTGNASVALSGNLRLGYGNSGTTPQQTERQIADITAREGTGPAQAVAKIAHRRISGTQTPLTYYPAGANATTYASMLQSDAGVTGAGYTLHTAIQGEHTYAASYATATPLVFNGSGTRTIHVDYTLTLHRRPGGWVNDDIIINPPTVRVNC